MFKKLKSLGGGSKGRQKFRIDVSISELNGLSEEVSQCRVVWARQAKVSVTKTVPVNKGHATFNEELGQIATLTRDSRGQFDSKEYHFKLQSPERSNQHKYVTLGKAVLDMARFAGDSPSRPQDLKVTIPVARNQNAILMISVSCSAVKGVGDDDDSMSVVTGVSGLSAIEQDLSGFDNDSRRGSVSVSTPLRTVTEETDDASSRQAKGSTELQVQATSGAGNVQITEVQQELDGLRLQNKQLEDEMQSLKIAGAAACAATAATVISSDRSDADLAEPLKAAQRRVAELEAQLSAKQPSAVADCSEQGGDGLRKQLEEAKSTITSLQAELAVAKAVVPQISTAESGVPPDVAAKLAMYETKIQELVLLVEEQGGHSEREADLEARLKEAEERIAELEADGLEGADAAVRHRLESSEQELAEAENMATEALNMLEAAQAENAQLHEELNQVQMDMDWQQRKAVKEKADWEARMQDGFRRVEESVVMAERLQKEKEELQARYDLLLADCDALQAQLDPSAVDEQVQAEVERAKLAAEQQAHIEVESLQQRIKEMEEFVEKADAQRLEMAAKVTDLTGQLAAVKREEQDSFDQVKTAEERADGLMLELQYLQHEKERLQGELTLARDQQERVAADSSREVGGQEARAAELASQLDTIKAQLRQAEQEKGEIHSRQLRLEEELESSRLKLAAAATAGGVAGAAVAAGAAGSGAPHGFAQELEDRRRAAEDRAAQLEATSRELSQVRARLQISETERETLQAAVQAADRSAASMQSRLEQLEEAARAREVQAAQMEQLQRDMAAAMLAAKEHSNTASSLSMHKGALEGQLAHSAESHRAEVAALAQQLEEAHRLADFSSGELAGVVQQLAVAEAERKELGDKVAELRDDLSRMRQGNDGELRARIEKLERELLITRNARDVNALFKVEHDRIATELIETKLVWAEAQEQIVKLKQSLVKSQEKTMSFASKLTRLETKFYRKLQGKSKEEKEKKKERQRSTSGAEGR